MDQPPFDLPPIDKRGKSKLPEPAKGTTEAFSVDVLGRSYYLFCIEQALTNVRQARALVKGDSVEEAHDLAGLEAHLTIIVAAA